MHRLYEEADESGDSGDNLLRRWPTTKGYFYKSDGVPLSNSASRHAYHIFNRYAPFNCILLSIILFQIDDLTIWVNQRGINFYHVNTLVAALSGPNDMKKYSIEVETFR